MRKAIKREKRLKDFWQCMAVSLGIALLCALNTISQLGGM